MPKLQKVFKYEMRHLNDGWVTLVNNSPKDFAEDIYESMCDPGCG